MFKSLSKESPCSTRRVVDRLADLWVDRFDHNANDLTRSEELPTIISFLSHLEEQPLIDLRQRKDVCGVNRLIFDLIYFVENVEKVALGIDTCTFNPRHNFTDHFL